MEQQFATVIENRPLTDQIYQMKVRSEVDVTSVSPGQFYYLHVNTGGTPLLRRPISVHDVDIQSREISFIYRVQGEGTTLLSQKKAGDRIDLLGSLGNGFSLPKRETNRRVVLLGGGIGIPPLYYLGKKLKEAGYEVTSLLGYSSKDDAFLVEQFAEFGEVRIASIDGTIGQKGTVLDLITEADDWQTFYSCGPKGMLKAIQQKFSEHIEGYLSLEERMGCGVGACYGCVVKVEREFDERGYKKVCSDGPVFSYQEVIL